MAVRGREGESSVSVSSPEEERSSSSQLSAMWGLFFFVEEEEEVGLLISWEERLSFWMEVSSSEECVRASRYNLGVLDTSSCFGHC